MYHFQGDGAPGEGRKGRSVRWHQATTTGGTHGKALLAHDQGPDQEATATRAFLAQRLGCLCIGPTRAPEQQWRRAVGQGVDVHEAHRRAIGGHVHVVGVWEDIATIGNSNNAYTICEYTCVALQAYGLQFQGKEFIAGKRAAERVSGGCGTTPRPKGAPCNINQTKTENRS